MSRVCIALLCVLLAGCTSAIPVPTQRDADIGARFYPGLTLDELHRGRQLYIAKCASCHTLYLPSARGPAQWPVLVEQMSERASLTPLDRAAIERYLTTAASSVQGAGAPIAPRRGEADGNRTATSTRHQDPEGPPTSG